MKRIIEIVPARPGWYSRWRPAPETTRACPVAVWVLVEEADGTNREVIGIDAEGRWPGADDTPVEFVRYLFQPPEAGQPEDATGQIQSPDERFAATSRPSAAPG